MLHASNNDYDWLGLGMYFWENNFRRALHFVQEQQRRRLKGKRTITEPAVLGAVLDLGFRKLDCAIVEHVHFQMRRKRKPFDSVRGVFMGGEPLCPTAGFYDKSHIQICVCNPNCIKGFFIPRSLDKKWPMP
jgi:hypothetical protein